MELKYKLQNAVWGYQSMSYTKVSLTQNCGSCENLGQKQDPRDSSSFCGELHYKLELMILLTFCF